MDTDTFVKRYLIFCVLNLGIAQWAVKRPAGGSLLLHLNAKLLRFNILTLFHEVPPQPVALIANQQPTPLPQMSIDQGTTLTYDA